MFLASLAKCARPASDLHARDSVRLPPATTRSVAQPGVRACTHKRPVRGPLSGANRKTFSPQLTLAGLNPAAQQSPAVRDVPSFRWEAREAVVQWNVASSSRCWAARRLHGWCRRGRSSTRWLAQRRCRPSHEGLAVSHVYDEEEDYNPDEDR